MAERDSFTVLKIAFLAFLVLNLLLGLACFGCGIWFHASADLHAYLTVFVKSKNDELVLAAAGMLLAAGLILSLLTAVAGVGVFLNEPKLLRLFVALIWIVLVLGLISGFIAIGFRHDIHRFVKTGMMDQLHNYYTWDGKIGKAWNRLQVKKRCCGVDGSWDYADSDWFASENPDPVKFQSFVPDSCCTLNFNQDRELSWVDPQNLQLKDKKRCNEDAEGNKDTTANLNKKGCFSALFAKNPDVWHDQDILTILNIIAGLGLSVGFLQIITILFSLRYIQAMNSRADGTQKSLTARY